MASRNTPGPKNSSKKTDGVNKTPPPKPSNIEDLGDLTDLGAIDSMTISALAEAAAGQKNAPVADDDDDDALGLGKVNFSLSGPPSGILRPSALHDDDSLSLDVLPSNPGAEASLSFVARSDIRGGDSEIGDMIATGAIKPTGRTPAWFAPPKSGRLRPTDGPLSGKMKPSDPPSGSRLITSGEATPEHSDIFGGTHPTGSSIPQSGDSNLLSVMAGHGESSNILSGYDSRGPSSDLFGDSRILTDNIPESNRPSSDILAGSRISSDILVGSQSTPNSSDILAGSSLFDAPEKQTDKLSGSKSISSPDQFVPLFDELEGEGSSIVLNRPKGRGVSGSPDPIDDDPGLISFDIPKKVKKTNSSGGDAIDIPEDTDDDRTSFMAIPEDEDDALAAEFLGGGVDRSGVNLLGQFEHQETMSEGDEEDSNEDVFNARTMMDIDIEAGSGLNLLTPGSEKLPRVGPGPKSESIFSGPASGKIEVKSGGSEVVSKSGPNSPASIFGPETAGGPSSAIFPVGKKKKGGSNNGGQVSFEMPAKGASDQTDRMQASGLIDWSKGTSDSDQLSLRTQMTDQMSASDELRKASPEDTSRTAQKFELEESDSVFDVHLPEDASTESQLFKAEQYARAAAAGTAVAESGIIAGRSGKIPKVEPVSSRTKFVAPPPPKRSHIGWIGGTAAGLLVGAGLSSAAFFSGMIPMKSNPNAEVALLREDYESKLKQSQADLNAAVESSKQQAVKDAQEAFKKTELELNAKLNTAVTTARAANQARDVTEKKFEAARKDSATANAKVDEARSELAMAVKARDEAMTELATSKAALTEKTNLAMAAAGKVKAAESASQQATATLVTAVKELQAANLIDPKADPAKSFAAIPDAIKKAAVAGATPDGKKLQELTGQLLLAKKEADAAKAAALAEKSKADTAVANARKDVTTATEKLTAELAKVKSSTSAEVEKAVATASDKWKGQLATLTADLKREQDERKSESSKYEAKLAAQAEEFRQQITAARAGAMVAQTDTERNAAEKAARLFGVGTDAYFEGRFGEAITALSEATKAHPSDARAWYYLGLSQWMNGDRTAAAQSYQTAAQWEARSVTAARQVGPALERVQGPARTFLETFRP